MNINALVAEFMGPRAPGWLVLDEPEVLGCAIDAARFYAAYGDIKSISLSDLLPGAPSPSGGLGGDIGYLAPPTEPDLVPAPLPVPSGIAYWPLPLVLPPMTPPSLPIKSLGFVTADTVLSMGEWALIRPLFVLYTERENAMRLEASRASGLEVYGRAVSEIASDIAFMESPDGLPSRAFSHAVIEVI